MRKNKIISSILAGALTVTSLAGTAFAATSSQSIIDTDRTGTINVHKIIENDGDNKQAFGLGVEEGRIPVNNIGFDYAKIAEIENIRGIIVSEDGNIDWNAGNGEVQVGAFYKGTPALDSLIDASGVVPEATYIKTSVVGDPNEAPNIQYEFNDQRAADLLSAEQDAVDAAAATLAEKEAALKAARGANNAAQSAASSSSGNKQDAADALQAANSAKDAAQSALTAAQTALDNATNDANDAADALSAANDALDDATAAYNDALANYSGNDDSTLKELKAAQAALLDAQNQAKEAAQALSNMTARQAEAQAAYDKADEALTAAQNILDEANAAAARAALGDPDSITGTANAVAYATTALANAQTYFDQIEAALEAANTAKTDAEAALAAAQTALDDAVTAATDAATANDQAYAEFSDAVAALKAAQIAHDQANSEAQDALAAQSAAQDAYDNANTAYEDAVAAAEAAQAAYDAISQTSSDNDDAAAASSADLQNAKDEYDAALAAYKTAVDALDTAAETAGIEKVYTAESLKDMMEKITATLSEEAVTEWVRNNTGYTGSAEGNHTDDRGVVSFSGLPLGLYMVAETDYSYHDGIAGAYNDKTEGGSINNDQLNHYDTAGGVYTITPIDANGQETTHEYAYGDVYREDINPEFPVIDTPSAPFLVSVPMVNATDTTVNDVAAGDNYGEAGSVWQYTVDVYPKNQTTAIYKRTLDPDESSANASLRTSEDYQIGDTIEQVIWAEAPSLQPNYLKPNSAVDGNKHLGYVISDTMDAGTTFTGISSVTILPAAQMKGANNNAVSYIYFNPEGGRCTAEEALVDPSNPETSELNHITKYYDAEGHEVTKEVFEAASDLNIKGEAAVGKSVDLYYKKFIASGASYNAYLPSDASAFDINMNAAEDEGITLTEGVDYTLVNTDNNAVELTDGNGNVETVISKGTHGFAVVLTPTGLQKMNGRKSDSVVVVKFTSVLNANAKIGQAGSNSDCASLHWVNSNTSIRSAHNGKGISSNEVYGYTYELVLKKEGVTDATNVKFAISRTDAGDLNQAEEKDLTDTVSGVYNFGADDSMRFVQEAPGIYHVWCYIPDAVSEGDAADAFETTEINGVVFNTVTPAADGTLKIKGLDSNSYTFKEIATETGKSLLKDSFDVVLTAQDDEDDSVRDGRLKTATVTTGGSEPIDITIGAIGTTGNDSVDGDKNLGIASMAVNNYNIVDLRTGGAGRTLIYICGGAMLAAMGIGAVIISKKRKGEEE